MSRIGNQPIEIPQDVEVNISPNSLTTKGKLGSLFLQIPDRITVEITDKNVIVKRKNDEKKVKALHGLVRSLIKNNITGVSQGWSKILQLVGVGFKAQTDGKKLTLIVGFSHSVEYTAKDGIVFTVKGNFITISGIDKQLVGETAAQIRRVKPPEPYKGKGIRYKDEIIKLKPGKAAKTAGLGAAAK